MQLYSSALQWLLFLYSTQETQALNMLLIFPVGSKSHAILGDGYVKELTQAGHNITIMTASPNNANNSLVTEIDVSFTNEAIIKSRFHVVSDLVSMKGGKYHEPDLMALFSTQVLESLVRSSTFQDFINDKTQKFDVIVVEWFFTHTLISLGQVFQCPVVVALSTESHSYFMEVMEYHKSPAVAVTMNSLNTIPHQSFLQRVEELIYWGKSKYYRWTTQTPIERILYESIIAPAAKARGVKNLLSYHDAIMDVSLVLYNSHPSIGLAQSLPPNMIPIGGYHVERPTPSLPQDLQNLLDESKHGVILFSMGSILRSEQLTSQTKTDLLKTFARLKQTVLWKSNVDLPDKPKNVIVRKWFPQQSILAHPNMRIFITHGGLLSTIEAIHFQVPLVAVPMFGDHFINTRQAAGKGFAIAVDARNMAEDIDKAIDLILNNESYAKAAKLVSSYYHDRPRPPGEELVYWIEHIARTNGAPHLRSVTRHVTVIEYLYLDLLAVIAFVIVCTSAITYLCWRFYCKNKDYILSFKKEN